MFTESFLKFKMPSHSSETANWNKAKLEEIYHLSSSEYYIKEGNYDFDLSKQQLLALLSYIIKETQEKYPLFTTYKKQITNLAIDASELDKNASLNRAKKTLEEHLWFICNQPIQSTLLDRYIVDLCAIGAASNLDMAVRHFSATSFDSALHACKEELVREVIHSIVQRYNLCPYKGNEIHYVNAYFNHVAEEFGCVKKIDEFAPAALKPDVLEKLRPYLKRKFTVSAFLQKLHVTLPPIPTESFNGSDEQLYKSIADYAQFIAPPDDVAELTDHLLTLYKSEFSESESEGVTHYHLTLTPIPDWQMMLDALLVEQLCKKNIVYRRIYIKIPDNQAIKPRYLVFNGTMFLSKLQENDKETPPFRVLDADTQARLQYQFFNYIITYKNIGEAGYTLSELFDMLDKEYLVKLYKVASNSSLEEISELTFQRIMRYESLYPLFLKNFNSIIEKHREPFLKFLSSVSLSVLLDEQELIRLVTNLPVDSAKLFLFMAAKNGYVSILKYLIQNSADINQINNRGVTPLYLAVENSHMEMVVMLLENGADANKATKEGVTPLFIAAKKANVGVIQALINGKADVNHVMNDGATPLVMAVEANQVNAILALIEGGANVNHLMDKGATLLCIAAQYGHVEAINTLVPYADVNQVMDKGFTPLCVAVLEGHINAIHVPIEKGANVNWTINDSQTPLFLAVQKGNVEAIHALLNNNAAINQLMDNGLTPLFMATKLGHIEAIHALLQHNADINQTTGAGGTPLFLAAWQGNEQAVHVLLKHKADVNKARKNITPLAIAALQGYKSIVETLLLKDPKLKTTLYSYTAQQLIDVSKLCYSPEGQGIMSEWAALPVNKKRENIPLHEVVSILGYAEIASLIKNHTVTFKVESYNSTQTLFPEDNPKRKLKRKLDETGHDLKKVKKNGL